MNESWQFHPAVAAIRNRLDPVSAWFYAEQLRCRGIARDDFAGAVRHLRAMARAFGHSVDINPYAPGSALHAAWGADCRRNGAYPSDLPQEVIDCGKPDAMAVTLPHVVEALGGRMAFDGEPLQANPYPMSDARYRQWETGWAREVARHVPKQKRRISR